MCFMKYHAPKLRVRVISNKYSYRNLVQHQLTLTGPKFPLTQREDFSLLSPNKPFNPSLSLSLLR
ncbi:hypothetical protein MTR67_022833 [Solanum verrucosum]|uniref:Uncharacterized protein n=1 Tax=Solanum verrucosum TaxID=315347 RepID=A0AAF0QW12_SOLVR|nr:hypothetical protein MTR67_022833 [Solanum verrucosum]